MILMERFGELLQSGGLVSGSQLHLFPDTAQRELWDAVDPEAAAVWLAEAEPLLTFNWPALPADRYAAYARTGNLLAYLTPYWERRSVLGTMVIAECLEGRGRYMDQIMNGIFCICEETTWVIPHHNADLQKERDEGEVLPAAADHRIELASAETGALLALTYSLLHRQLRETGGSRLVNRIFEEARKQLLDPYLNRDDYWWMGFVETKHINNWNPWCNSNMLLTFLFLEQDEERRREAVLKIVRSLDEYLRRFPSDGCCEEGPMYWGGSGGALYYCLELLTQACGGSTDVFDVPLVQDIGRYLYRAHIHEGYFVSFADGDARLSISGSAYGYGKRISDEYLLRLGANAPLRRPERLNWFSLYAYLTDLFQHREKKELAAAAPYIRDAWMSECQVMTAREHSGSPDGLFLAAKGGSNEEAHNHNDVGNFIVYADGCPILVDLGTENYTAKTFGPERYSLWYLQSAYHNLPTVGGVMQREGKSYLAQNTICVREDPYAELSMDIGRAYPKQAGIRSWRRTFRLNRGTDSSVQIMDDFELEHPAEELFYSLITPWKPYELEAGSFALPYGEERRVIVRYDAEYLQMRVERIALADERLQRNWGECVYRVILQENMHRQQGKRTLYLSIEE